MLARRAGATEQTLMVLACRQLGVKVANRDVTFVFTSKLKQKDVAHLFNDNLLRLTPN